MNKQLFGLFFVFILTVFVATPIIAQEKQRQIKSTEKFRSESQLRSDSLREINLLIKKTQKLSADIHGIVRNTTSTQGDFLNKKDSIAAAKLADKLDDYLRQLTEQKRLLQNTDRNFVSDLKRLSNLLNTAQHSLRGSSDTGQLLQFQIQEANNIYARANDTIRMIMSKESDTKDELIDNLKD